MKHLADLTKRVETLARTADDRIWVHNFDEEAAAKFGNLVFKVAEKDEREPIIVYVDSYGGYIDALVSMLSIMDGVPNPFITVATGKAMSAGAVLLSHGDIRCVGQHARVMIHEMQAGTSGHINDIKTDAREHDRLNEYVMGLLAQNCKKPLSKIRKLWGKDRDLYMTAQQAVDFGLADNVGIPLVERYSAFDMKFLDTKDAQVKP